MCNLWVTMFFSIVLISTDGWSKSLNRRAEICCDTQRHLTVRIRRVYESMSSLLKCTLSPICRLEFPSLVGRTESRIVLSSWGFSAGNPVHVICLKLMVFLPPFHPCLLCPEVLKLIKSCIMWLQYETAYDCSPLLSLSLSLSIVF